MIREFGGPVPPSDDVFVEESKEQLPVFDITRVAESLSPTKRFASPSDYGALSGVQQEVKPAVSLSELRNVPTKELSERFLLRKRLVIDRVQIDRRIEQEPALAEYVGWDKTKSLEENLETAVSSSHALPIEQAKFAFVLGFPETAIRGFARRKELLQNGLPSFRDLVEATRDYRVEEPLKTEYWSSMNRSVFKEIGQLYQQIRNRVDRVEPEERSALCEQLLEQTRKKITEDLMRIYEDEFDLSREDAELMVYEDFIQINNFLGQPVYEFKTFGRDADKAPDILALRKKVEDAFAVKETDALVAK